MSKKRTSKPTSKEATIEKAITRLSAELKRASEALGSISSDVPSGQQLRQLVEKFQHELAGVITQGAGQEQQRVATTAPSRSIPQLTTYVLERISGAVAKTLIVQEEATAGTPRGERAYRVGCLELLDDQAWTWIDAEPEGDFLRMFFPEDEFSGLPRFLDLESPRQPKVGQNWRLLRGDRGLAAVFSVRSVDVSPGELHHRWAHGDIVRALYRGDIFVARFIRNEGDDRAVVHWLADDTFSEIPRTDILAPSASKWTLDLAPPDVEIEGAL
jgi:hypothetical protein